MHLPLSSLVVVVTLGTVSVTQAQDMEGPISPCPGVEVFRFEQSSYASIQEDVDVAPIVSSRSKDEFEFDEMTYTESALTIRDARGDKIMYARGTQTSTITENTIRVVNNNYSSNGSGPRAHLSSMSSVVVMFMVDDNLEADSGFSMFPSRHHSVWLNMSVLLTSGGNLDLAKDTVPGSMVRLIGPDGLIYTNSSRIDMHLDDRRIDEQLEFELTPGMYILAVDVMTEHYGAPSYYSAIGRGLANVRLRFSETASQGDVGTTILSQYRETTTSYDSVSDTGPCKSSLREVSGPDAWSYQDSDIRALNTYGAFYNFARGANAGVNRNSDSLLSVEFRLEENANMDVMLRGTYEVHKPFSHRAASGYLVRVEDLSSGDVVYMKAENYRSSGSGGISSLETTMLPAGDYLLTIETYAMSRKGHFPTRARLDASMHLIPSVSFWN